MPFRTAIAVAVALCALAPEAEALELVLAEEAAPREPWPWRLTVRLSPPFTNAEILDDEMGTMALVAGSVEVDFLELVGVEAGGSWLHTETLDDPAWDVFVRVNGLLGLYDGRTAEVRDDTWRFEAVGSVGYRFLHEVEELEPLSGSLDLHALTLGAGAAAIWWFEPALGLEFRLVPTVSIALAESTSGAWGQSAASTQQPGVVVPDAMPGTDTGSTPSFASSATLGNADETDWGLDLELTVGIVF